MRSDNKPDETEYQSGCKKCSVLDFMVIYDTFSDFS